MRGFGQGFGQGFERGFGGMHVAGAILGCVLFLAVIAAIVLLVIWIVRTNRRLASLSKGQSQSGPSAKELLQARYARGEVTQAEYKKLLADLDKN